MRYIVYTDALIFIIMLIIVVLAAQYHYVDGVQHGSVGGLQGRTSGGRGRESRKELGLHLDKREFYFSYMYIVCII